MGGIGPWQARSHTQGSHHLPKPPRAPRSTAAAAFWKHGGPNGKPSHISSTPPNTTPPGPPPGMPPEAAPAAAEVAAAAKEASVASAVSGGASPEAAKSAAWWSKLSDKWGSQVKRMGVDLNKAKTNFKAPQMPSSLGKVKMDVDVLNPAINSLKANWLQLPEPVRQAAPVLGVIIVLTSFTRYVHRDEMQRAEARHKELENDLKRVKARRDELEAEVTDLSARIKRANQNLSIEMADALGKAAQAAATATAAAATAATACAYPGQPHQQGPWLEPPRRQRRRMLQDLEAIGEGAGATASGSAGRSGSGGGAGGGARRSGSGGRYVAGGVGAGAVGSSGGGGSRAERRERYMQQDADAAARADRRVSSGRREMDVMEGREARREMAKQSSDGLAGVFAADNGPKA